MKKQVLMLAALSLSFSAVAGIETVSRFDMGKDNWPFIREEMMLSCEPGHILLAIHDGTLAQYPLNAEAEVKINSGMIHGEPIEKMIADDPANPGHKKSLAPVIARAEKLCR